MSVTAVFPNARQGAGMYESFYLRAVSPLEPVGAWIRYTVHKRPGAAPRGSLWCTVFDVEQGRPFQDKLSSEEVGVPPGGWISIAGATLTPDAAQGACGEASWSLRFATSEPELRHLPREWMYRAPLPRTKLTSPAPAASFEGRIELSGLAHPVAHSPAHPLTAPRTLELSGWRGMVGHNWGAEHAERWIWLHGVGFADDPDAWVDVAIGRVRVGRWLTPWVANGALSLEGRRIPLGGLGRRGLLVAESPERCRLSLPGGDKSGAVSVDIHVQAPREALAGWSYSDPDGSAHDVSNCSVAALSLTLREPGVAAARTLHTAHGAVYELGMREHDHGVPIAPFADG
jgi:hypothetical protein